MMNEDEEESSSSCSSIILEITLISAQSLKPPANLLRRINAYATLIPPSPESESSHHGSVVLRTRTDPVGSTNPTWNDKFLLRIHPSLLSSSSSSSISVDILADAGFLRPDPLVGSVRILLSNHHGLLHRRPSSDLPTFAALGIRRPSGRFHGVLNVAFAVLSHVPNLVHHALSSAGPAAAVGYRDLMEMGMRMGGPLKELNYYPNNNAQEDPSNPNPSPNPNKGMSKKKKKMAMMIKKKKGDENDEVEEEEEEVEEEKENLCGLGLGLGFGFGRGFHLQSQSRNHVSPSDQILNLQHIPWVLKDRSFPKVEEFGDSSIH